MSRKLRTAVYAIARDEEHHVARWAASTKDADVVLLADTGSKDRTVDRARSLGIDVQEISVEPFRYDIARNLSLDVVPDDVDVCIRLDLDEVLVGGWRDALAEAWRPGTTRGRCRFEWSFRDGEPALRFRAPYIHARHGFQWRYPVHEELVFEGDEVTVDTEVGIVHLRDSARPRPQYLPLLRIAVDEHPEDAYRAMLLAAELRLNGLAEEARQEFHRALSLGLDPCERQFTMLMLSHLEGQFREDWLLAACAEFPQRREPWCLLADLHAGRGEWRASMGAAKAALRVTEPADDHLATPACWGGWPEDLAATSCRELGDREGLAFFSRWADAARTPPAPTYIVVPVPQPEDAPAWAGEPELWGAERVFVLPNEPGPLNLSEKWNHGLDLAETAARGEGHHRWNVLVLNDDVEFDSDLVPQLAAGLRSSDENWIAFPNWAGLDIADGAAVPMDGSGPYRMPGWAFMVRGESGLRADPQFRWWFGDDDLQRQVAALGRKLVCVGGTWVRHLHPGESTDSSPELQAVAEQDRQAYAAKWNAPT